MVSPSRIKNSLLVFVLLVLAMLATGCASSRSAAFAGSSWPSVATGEDTIYLAAGSFVYAIDPEDGNIRWRYPEDGERGGSFYAMPALGEDGIVIVGDYTDTLHALRDNGNSCTVLWTFTSNRARFVGGAAIQDDVVYVGTVDGRLHALDIVSGEPLAGFEFGADRGIWSTPLLDGDTLYVTTMDHHLYALNATTGAERWHFDTGEEGPGGAMVGTPTLYEGTLYFGAFDNRVYALAVDTQEVRWLYETSNWVWGSLAVADGTLVGADLDGNVFALNAEDGDELWTVSVEGPVVGTPVIDDGLVYFTAEDGHLYVLELESGSEAQRPTEVDVEFTSVFLVVPTGTELRNVPLYAPPVLYDDLILIGVSQGDQPLVALDREDLTIRWRLDPNP